MSASTTTTTAPNVNKNHARETHHEADSCWRLEPHVCRVCFGRIASRQLGDRRVYECTNCGLDGVGGKPSTICACGIKLRKSKGDGRSAVTMADAGIRCHRNNAVSPEFPALYVASYGGAQSDT